MSEEVVVNIAPNGTDFTVETKGFKGKGCQAIIDAVESVGKVKSHKNTDEFYKSPNPNNVTVGS